MDVRVLLRKVGVGAVVCSSTYPVGETWGPHIEDDKGRPIRPDARILTITGTTHNEVRRLFKQPLTQELTDPTTLKVLSKEVARHRYKLDPTKLKPAKQAEYLDSRGTRTLTLTEAEMQAAMVQVPEADGKTIRNRGPEGRLGAG